MQTHISKPSIDTTAIVPSPETHRNDPRRGPALSLDCSTCPTRSKGTMNGVNRAWSFNDLMNVSLSYISLMPVMTYSSAHIAIPPSSVPPNIYRSPVRSFRTRCMCNIDEGKPMSETLSKSTSLPDAEEGAARRGAGCSWCLRCKRRGSDACRMCPSPGPVNQKR